MRILLGCLLFFVIYTVSGQESKKYLKLKGKENSYVEGYFMRFDSTKEVGLIKVPGVLNKTKIYNSITFIDKEGDRFILYPHSIREFGSNTAKFESDGETFFRLFKKGSKVCLYEFEKLVRYFGGSEFGGPSVHIEKYLYVRKLNEDVFRLTREKGFINEFSEYFGDCEELKQKILKGMLHYKDLEKIIDEYNSCK